MSGADTMWLGGLVVPWIWSALMASLPRNRDHFAGPLGAAGALLTALALTGSLLQDSPSGESHTMLNWGWLPALNLQLIVLRDGLTAFFGLLVAWVAVLVTFYALRYLPQANHHEHAPQRQVRFYALMSLFTAALLGVVTAGNLIQLYFFWELTSIASFLLIGYWNHQAEARKGASLALGLTVTGGVAMLAGFFWLGSRTGLWTITELLARAPQLQAEAWLEGCAVLMLMGALAKSAQLPFSSWLPAAMHAPTPVSAFLHSSALLAAGVYLLSRFYLLLHKTTAWSWLLIVPGALGVLYGGLLAFRQNGMKPLLAYSTIEQFAFMFIGFGIGTQRAVKAALYAFGLHTIIKAGLFLVAGAVTHVSGSKTFEGTGRLIDSNRVLALMAALLGFSLAGATALGAFYYEEAYLKAAKEIKAWGLYAVYAAGGTLSVVYMIRFLYEIFLAGTHPEQSAPRVPRSMGAVMGLLAGAALLTAFHPDWIAPLLLDAALSTTLGEPVTMRISIHITGVFWTSAGTLCLGAGIWLGWRYSEAFRFWWRRCPEGLGLGGRFMGRLYAKLSESLLALHSGDLRRYLRIMFGGFIVLAASIWMHSAGFPQWPDQPIELALTLVLACMVVTAAATLFIRHHLTFVLLLTMLGFAMAGAFILMGAPNVALAQVLVETLIDLSIILALRETHFIDPDRSMVLKTARRDPLRWVMSVGIGLAVGLGTYWATRSYPQAAVGQWYATAGFEITGMEDFVATILTDFRALDTLVEVLVFTAGVFAVIGLYWHERISGE